MKAGISQYGLQSYPPFEPTRVQQDNMRALLVLLNHDDKRKGHLEEFV